MVNAKFDLIGSRKCLLAAIVLYQISFLHTKSGVVFSTVTFCASVVHFIIC